MAMSLALLRPQTQLQEALSEGDSNEVVPRVLWRLAPPTDLRVEGSP